ncbi:MAG: hypothetical protein LBJ60_07575 [Tannerellaceae bacterium]|nr:hypothetical protein [Tannerellaceae bacterium]
MVIIGVFYHAELIFRTSFQEKDIPNLYEIRGKYYFNKPYLRENIIDEEYSSSYITNKQGFRISAAENPDNCIDTCDWLFLGDSFTQGAQVDYSDLFTTKAYRYFPDKIILNAGISGYSIADALNYYVSEGYKLKPSKVFLQLCIFNDFMNVTENQAGITEYLMQYSRLYGYLFYNAHYANPADLPLGRWTEPFYPTEENNKDYNIFYKKISPQKKEDVENLIHYLSTFKKETSKNHADLCILLIPTKEQISYKYYKEVIDSFGIDEANLDMGYPNRLIDSLSHMLNFELIDLYNPFRKDTFFPFFRNDEHLNSHGHTIIAELILQAYKKESNLYRYLTTGNNGDRYPTLFNNGRTLLFQTSISGCFQVATSDTSFHSLEILTRTPLEKIHPVMSNDNRWISYTQGDQEKGNTKVILQDYNTGSTRYVTEDEFEYGSIPFFSPDNRYLAYASWFNLNGISTNPVITLYNIETREKNVISDDLYESWRPIFHPEESIVYYISKEFQDDFSIVSQNLQTGEKKIVLKTGYNIWDPAISPNGHFIVFAGYKDQNWDLFLLRLHDRRLVQLTATTGDEWDPSFGNSENDIWFSGRFGSNNGIYRLTR